MHILQLICVIFKDLVKKNFPEKILNYIIQIQTNFKLTKKNRIV